MLDIELFLPGSLSGFHSGACTLLMKDGSYLQIAHSVTEATAKVDPHSVAPASSQVAFDLPGQDSLIVDALQVQSVAPGLHPLSPSTDLYPSRDLFPTY